MVAVAILAAGKGTRMKSDRPKVLHKLGGRSLVEWVLQSTQHLDVSHCFVIVGYQGDRVKEALAHRVGSHPPIQFVDQPQQLGTGHAVQQILPYLPDFQGDLLVLNGDVPLLRQETLKHLVQTHRESQNAATLLTAQIPEPQGYGRVFCDGQNRLIQIVEDRDCTVAQRQNHRVNVGVYCFHWPALQEALPQLSSNNDQQEYYLTDVVRHMTPIMAVDAEDFQETLGINNRKQMAQAYAVLQDRIKDHWLTEGVTFVDPDTVTIDDTVQLAADVIIEPETHLRGTTTIGEGAHIGPGCLIENSSIGDHSRVLYSVVSDSCFGNRSRLGPYAHIRGEATIADDCRVGNFVEIKKSTLGDRTNVAHLSYLGDAELGERVNVGAGTITANYDGFQKHKTVIGSGTKTGSNSVLVAPVTVGENVTIAAGSTITENVPDNSLAVARSRQVTKENWTPRNLKAD